MDILIHRFASSQRPHLRVPPSPPAEYRAAIQHELWRQVHTYTGRLPRIIAPGYEEIPGGRPPAVILPGMPAYWDTLKRVCMPAGCATVMSGGAQGNSGAGNDFGNPSAYWKAEDLLDSTPNGSTLTAVGTETHVAGLLADAFSLDGSTKAYTCASNSHIAVPINTSGSVLSWIYIGSFNLGQGETWVWKGSANDASHEEWSLRDFGGNMHVGIGDGTSVTAIDSGTISAAAWHLTALALDWPNRVLHLYIDGNAAINATSITHSSYDGGGTLSLGYRNPTANNFVTGKQDTTAMWNAYCLSSGNVATMWNGGSGYDLL